MTRLVVESFGHDGLQRVFDTSVVEVDLCMNNPFARINLRRHQVEVWDNGPKEKILGSIGQKKIINIIFSTIYFQIRNCD